MKKGGTEIQRLVNDVVDGVVAKTDGHVRRKVGFGGWR